MHPERSRKRGRFDISPEAVKLAASASSSFSSDPQQQRERSASSLDRSAGWIFEAAVGLVSRVLGFGANDDEAPSSSQKQQQQATSTSHAPFFVSHGGVHGARKRTRYVDGSASGFGEANASHSQPFLGVSPEKQIHKSKIDEDRHDSSSTSATTAGSSVVSSSNSATTQIIGAMETAAWLSSQRSPTKVFDRAQQQQQQQKFSSYSSSSTSSFSGNEFPASHALIASPSRRVWDQRQKALSDLHIQQHESIPSMSSSSSSLPLSAQPSTPFFHPYSKSSQLNSISKSSFATPSSPMRSGQIIHRHSLGQSIAKKANQSLALGASPATGVAATSSSPALFYSPRRTVALERRHRTFQFGSWLRGPTSYLQSSTQHGSTFTHIPGAFPGDDEIIENDHLSFATPAPLSSVEASSKKQQRQLFGDDEVAPTSDSLLFNAADVDMDQAALMAPPGSVARLRGNHQQQVERHFGLSSSDSPMKVEYPKSTAAHRSPSLGTRSLLVDPKAASMLPFTPRKQASTPINIAESSASLSSSLISPAHDGEDKKILSTSTPFSSTVIQDSTPQREPASSFAAVATPPKYPAWFEYVRLSEPVRSSAFTPMNRKILAVEQDKLNVDMDLIGLQTDSLKAAYPSEAYDGSDVTEEDRREYLAYVRMFHHPQGSNVSRMNLRGHSMDEIKELVRTGGISSKSSAETGPASESIAIMRVERPGEKIAPPSTILPPRLEKLMKDDIVGSFEKKLQEAKSSLNITAPKYAEIKQIESNKVTYLKEKLIKLAANVRRDNFPSLPEDADLRLRKAHSSRDEAALIEKFGQVAHGHDIRTLTDGSWLNDVIINFYMGLIMERSKESNAPKVFVLNTLFLELLSKGYDRVARWSKKTDIFSLDYVFVPVHLGVHWCMAVINFRKKRFEYYDSLLGQNKSCLQLLQDYLVKEHMKKHNTPYDVSDWSFYIPKDIPTQENGFDCGVFACTFAEYISRDEPFDFHQRNMKYLRRRMMYEILTGKLVMKVR